VGAPDEIVAMPAPTMEIVFEPGTGGAVPASLAAKVSRSGPRHRLEVLSAELYDSIEQLKAAQARILSVTPVRPTLEDYFLELVGRDRAVAHAMEVER
jgi:hypothetical protein